MKKKIYYISNSFEIYTKSFLYCKTYNINFVNICID